MSDIAKLKAAAERAKAAVADYQSGVIDTAEFHRRAAEFHRLTDSPEQALELIDQNAALVAAHVNLKLLADVYRQAYEEALEAKDAQIAERDGALEREREKSRRMASRIAELEERNAEILRQARSFREAHESASEIIRRMERSKPVVTLPTTRLWAGKVACFEEGEVISALVAAGINLETGGE
ncbi:hypothetical protein AAAW47_001257 [Cronobacter sakazakii]